MFGLMETVVIVGVIILFFGARRIPQLGRALGQATKEFKKGLSEDEIDVTESSKEALLKRQKRRD